MSSVLHSPTRTCNRVSCALVVRIGRLRTSQPTHINRGSSDSIHRSTAPRDKACRLPMDTDSTALVEPGTVDPDHSAIVRRPGRLAPDHRTSVRILVRASQLARCRQAVLAEVGGRSRRQSRHAQSHRRPVGFRNQCSIRPAVHPNWDKECCKDGMGIAIHRRV